MTGETERGEPGQGSHIKNRVSQAERLKLVMVSPRGTHCTTLLKNWSGRASLPLSSDLFP